MRNLTIYLVVFLCTFMSKIYAQDTFEAKAKAIASNIERITKEEKQTLKNNVEDVNAELDKGAITKEQADEKKLQLAQATAEKIESRVSLEESKLTQLVKEKIDGKIAENDDSDQKTYIFSIKKNPNHKRDTLRRSERRTTSQFVFAAGVNNLVSNEMVARSNFRYLGSHFYEWGITYNTRLTNNSNLLHLKYGLSVMYNNLRPTDNRVFATNSDQTYLETAPIALKDSRFRSVNLVFPLHFELDFSKNKTIDNKAVFQSHKGFRLGFGGFAGVNLKSKQIIKFDDSFGNSITQKSKGNYNVNDFVYGVSTYIGYKETSLYLKYDLSPMFTDNPVDQNNISLGLRFDFN